MADYMFKVYVYLAGKLETIYLRQFIDPVDRCFDKFKTKLMERYDILTKKPFQIMWIDKEFDEISITSEDDLRIFMAFREQKIFVYGDVPFPRLPFSCSDSYPLSRVAFNRSGNRPWQRYGVGYIDQSAQNVSEMKRPIRQHFGKTVTKELGDSCEAQYTRTRNQNHSPIGETDKNVQPASGVNATSGNAKNKMNPNDSKQLAAQSLQPNTIPAVSQFQRIFKPVVVDLVDVTDSSSLDEETNENEIPPVVNPFGRAEYKRKYSGAFHVKHGNSYRRLYLEPNPKLKGGNARYHGGMSRVLENWNHGKNIETIELD